MRVRVKFGSASQVVSFDGRDTSQVSLEELRQSVSAAFHLENHRDFELSLNKQDVLTGDSETLSVHGIVSGDIIHVIGTNLPQAAPSRERVQNRVQPLATHSHGAVENGTSNTSAGTAAYAAVTSAPSTSRAPVATSGVVGKFESDMDVSEQREAGTSDGASGVRGSGSAAVRGSESDINRFLQEPLVVRESTGEQVPVLLEQMYSSVSCGSNNEALWVVLHTLMLETGFLPKEAADPTVMPDNWKRSGFYTCSYDYVISAQSVETVSLVGVPLGSSLAVHALSKSESSSFKTEHLQLKATDFVRKLSQDVPETYRALDRLSRLFKDTVCLPLINEIAAAAGVPERLGLLGLPFEVKLRIMACLDPRSQCRLGQVCQELCAIYRDKTVWRILYLRAFQRPDDCKLSRDWYEMFKFKYEEFKEDQERRRRIFYMDDTDPPWGFPGSGPFRPIPPRMPFPHLIGGDHDLNPEFAAGGVPPYGGRISLPDLGYQEPRGLRLPIRPQPRPGNMAGSPFSLPFRSSPFSGGHRGPFI